MSNDDLYIFCNYMLHCDVGIVQEVCNCQLLQIWPCLWFRQRSDICTDYTAEWCA